MTLLFNTMTLVVLPFWFLMIVLPRWKWTQKIIASPWIILPPVLGYSLLSVPHMPELVAVFMNPTPDTVASALSKPWGGTMFWAYAAAFDLFVGRWMYFDAQEREIHPVWVGFPLFIAIFLGPLGFLLYTIVRGIHHLSQKKNPSS